MRLAPKIRLLLLFPAIELWPSSLVLGNYCLGLHVLNLHPVILTTAFCLCLTVVLSTLRQLSTTTSILTDPSQLPEQASEAVTRMGKRSGES